MKVYYLIKYIVFLCVFVKNYYIVVCISHEKHLFCNCFKKLKCEKGVGIYSQKREENLIFKKIRVYFRVSSYRLLFCIFFFFFALFRSLIFKLIQNNVSFITLDEKRTYHGTFL